jgi:hypothetical protein
MVVRQSRVDVDVDDVVDGLVANLLVANLLVAETSGTGTGME